MSFQELKTSWQKCTPSRIPRTATQLCQQSAPRAAFCRRSSLSSRRPTEFSGLSCRRNLFRADNIHVMASKSGKMQAAHLRAWFTHVFFPYVQKDVALMVDSWSTYKQSGLIESVTPPGRDLLVVTVPPGTTWLCQPLDVFGIRMMKEFQKTVYDGVIQTGLLDELNGRNSLLKTLSLTMNQMCSPRFADMWTVGWNLPGYFEDTPEFLEFKTPKKYCFQSDAAKKKEKCHTAECTVLHFIPCAWCRVTFCFQHYFVGYHICKFINDPVFV